MLHRLIDQLIKLIVADAFKKAEDFADAGIDRRRIVLFEIQLETDAKFRIAITAHFLAKPQHGGGGHAGGLGQLADGHVHHLILVFADVVINHQLQGVELGDCFMGKHESVRRLKTGSLSAA